MIRHHNGKLIFGMLIVAFLCLAVCPVVSADTVTTGLHVNNTQVYGERGLTLATSFDETTIPQNYDRMAAQIQLGNDLYMTVPELHEEVISAYHDVYPELSESVGNSTYVYKFGKRLDVIFYSDGSLGLGRYSVEYVPSLTRSMQDTAIETVEYIDKDWILPAHTTARMKAWFSYGGGMMPIPHLVEILAISHNGDRTYTTKTQEIPDNSDNTMELRGTVTTTMISGSPNEFKYQLQLHCNVNGDVSRQSSKI